ncbi:MAG TPA: hypothetical protein VE735_03495 [Gammaproteobacteria bacterium]|nr:hypothetical protein [Gammaproteobacteria bacterium]
MIELPALLQPNRDLPDRLVAVLDNFERKPLPRFDIDTAGTGKLSAIALVFLASIGAGGSSPRFHHPETQRRVSNIH